MDGTDGAGELAGAACSVPPALSYPHAGAEFETIEAPLEEPVRSQYVRSAEMWNQLFREFLYAEEQAQVRRQRLAGLWGASACCGTISRVFVCRGASAVGAAVGEWRRQGFGVLQSRRQGERQWQGRGAQRSESGCAQEATSLAGPRALPRHLTPQHRLMAPAVTSLPLPPQEEAPSGSATSAPRRGFGDARSMVWRSFWAAHQRFFRHMCMAAKVPSVVRMSHAALKQGKCVVIGLQVSVCALLRDRQRSRRGQPEATGVLAHLAAAAAAAVSASAAVHAALLRAPAC